jgi:signal transduction histidine kinase
MRNFTYWFVTIAVTIIFTNQTHSYISMIFIAFISSRIIFELLKFPSEHTKYYFLRKAKNSFDQEINYKKKQTELIEKELMTTKKQNESLGEKQNTIQIQSEGKLVEAEYLTKKLLYQKQVFHFIGHDLKAPFQNIISFLSKSQSQNTTDFIRKNAEHGLSLINEILDTKTKNIFQRPEGKATYLPKHVKDLIKQFDIQGFTTISYLDNVDKVPLDNKKSLKGLTQALSNLLSNAKKYAIDPKKGSNNNQINLRFGLGDLPGNLQINIKDSGPGICKEIRKKLFIEPIGKTREGHGRGLIQLRKFLDDHGGEIKLSDDLHKTHFIVELPILNASTDDYLFLKDKVPQNKKIKKMHALIIDDSIDIHQILGLYLEELSTNIQVHSATNLKEAIELESRYDYDICFLDMHLEDVSGEHVFRQLTKINKETPVVAISASFEQEKIDQLKKIGISKTMTKSFDEKLIEKIIKEVIR